jgi:hypothetical protein
VAFGQDKGVKERAGFMTTLPRFEGCRGASRPSVRHHHRANGRGRRRDKSLIFSQFFEN